MIGPIMSQTSESNLRQSEHHNKTPEERSQYRTDKMTKKLGLSEAQAAKINALQLDNIIKEDVDRKAKKARMAQQQASIRAILTAEQAQKFDESMNKRKEKRKGIRNKKREKRKEMKMEEAPKGQEK